MIKSLSSLFLVFINSYLISKIEGPIKIVFLFSKLIINTKKALQTIFK